MKKQFYEELKLMNQIIMLSFDENNKENIQKPQYFGTHHIGVRIIFPIDLKTLDQINVELHEYKVNQRYTECIITNNKVPFISFKFWYLDSRTKKVLNFVDRNEVLNFSENILKSCIMLSNTFKHIEAIQNIKMEI